MKERVISYAKALKEGNSVSHAELCMSLSNDNLIPIIIQVLV